MIFSELYSAYYNAAAKIISAAIDGSLSQKEIQRIVSKTAFAESSMTILPALKEERWQLIKNDFSTPIKNKPTMPLTLLQKRWLKAVLNDPRVKLFDIEIDGLEDVDPLFTKSDYLIYDCCNDGDPYEDLNYISRFKIILSAIKGHTSLKAEIMNRKGEIIHLHLFPQRLEYSVKDDKFRLIHTVSRYEKAINLCRILSCQQIDEELCNKISAPSRHKMTLTMELTDERNSLERVMMHFSHFEKTAIRIDESHCRITIFYDWDDETEIVIRVLSFGPFIKVIAPESFRKLIIERLIRQKDCEL